MGMHSIPVILVSLIHAVILISLIHAVLQAVEAILLVFRVLLMSIMQLLLLQLLPAAAIRGCML
jgi:hypothetical protein